MMRKLFTKPRCHLAAYFLIAAAFAFTAQELDNQNSKTNRNAVVARTSIIDAGATSVRIGCKRDSGTIIQLRTAINRGRKNYEGYYEQGVITKDQLEQLRKQTEASLKDLVVPDCEKDVQVFLTKVAKHVQP